MGEVPLYCTTRPPPWDHRRVLGTDLVYRGTSLIRKGPPPRSTMGPTLGPTVGSYGDGVFSCVRYLCRAVGGSWEGHVRP